jgi:exonuclease SbcD
MKILHCADLHFTNKPQLLADIQKCCTVITNPGTLEAIDLIVIAGDLFDEGVQLGSPASLAAMDFVYRCGQIAPVVIIRGTSSHDAEGSINILSKLKTYYPVYATDRPEQIALDETGFHQDITPLPGVEVIISCLPSLTKANLMAYASGSTSETTREAVDLMRDMFQGWGVVTTHARAAGIPTILVGHGTVTGSELSTGQVMTGRDLEWSTGDLKLAKADLYCLGHIHKIQSWENIYYSGSITRLNYGETEKKGFFIHEIENLDMGINHTDSRFVETPARSMRTKRPEGLPGIEIVADMQAGDSIRIIYEVAEADIGKVDEQAIIEAALARGAVDVKIEKIIIPTVRVRAEGISRETSLSAKLDKWAETTGFENPENLYGKLADLQVREVEQVLEDYKGVQV